MSTPLMSEHMDSLNAIRVGDVFLGDCPLCGATLPITPVDGVGYLTCDAGCDIEDIRKNLGYTQLRIDVRDDAEDGPPDDKRSQAARVVDYVREHYKVIRASDGKVYALPRNGPRIVVTLPVLSSTVAAPMFEASGVIPSEAARKAAFAVLSADAALAEETRVHLRSAYLPAEGALYIDLGNAEGTIVRVSADGWRLCGDGDSSPAFRRTESTQALPVPRRGDADAKVEFAALLGWDVDSDFFALCWGWLTCVWLDDMPRPLLWITGEQGAGKTTRARMMLGLVDPGEELGAPPGKNERDDSTRAAGRYVPTFDNVRGISDATSDWLCRLVTGVAVERRTLYSDDGVHTSIIRRAGLATSIRLPYGLGPDALERLIVLRFDRLEHFAPERGLRKRFDSAAPSILAAVLDDLAGVLARLGEPLPGDVELQRMADYHAALIALDRHTGGRSADAYSDSVGHELLERMADDPWLAAVRGVVLDKGKDGALFITPAALVQAVETWLSEDERSRDAGSLKLPGERGIRGALENAATPLRRAGVTFMHTARGGRRGLEFRYDAEADETRET